MDSVNNTAGSTDAAPLVYARVAGFLYLGVIVFGIFAQAVRQNLIMSGDAAETAHNIIASESLFRFAFVSDLIMSTCWLFLALALYLLLKRVNKNLAALVVLFVMVGAAIQFINMLNHFATLPLLSGADYLKVFTADQLQALVLFFLNLHTWGYTIAGIFHGLWLLPLGYLVFKSGYLPRILGSLLMIGCFGFQIDLVTRFLFPGYEVITYPGMVIAAIAEFSFCGWLLIKGVDVVQWEKRALEAA